jgi:serine/threonine protein kinase
MIGTVLSNRYELIAELGSGGMAWVYLARDLREDQLVAVKVLYPQHSKDLNFLQRFMQEAKLAMSLSQCAPQRQIVCVLDYGSDRDTHYLVMEFVEGRDLRQVLEDEGALPWQQALDIACQVASALEHAHNYDIVHRDIKPGNIMLLPDGGVRVLDFGIARAQTSPHLTLSGFVGSPHYTAPEQAMGQSVDIRADIYSLGVVLYRMLSGKLPFQAETPWAIVNKHLAAPPPSLKNCCPDLPLSVVQLVEKALDKQRENRFQTPHEMVQAIEAVLDGQELPLDVLPIAADTSVPSPALSETYKRAQQAFENEAWQEAIAIFSQIVKIDPNYRDVNEKLVESGQQIRLGSLYDSAKRSLQTGQWDQAVAQLDEIANVVPGYRDVDELRELALARQIPEVGEQTMVAGPEASEDEQDSRDSSGSFPLPTARAERQSRRYWLWAALLALAVALTGGIYLLYVISQKSPAVGAQPTSTSTATLMSNKPSPSEGLASIPRSSPTQAFATVATALPATATYSPTPTASSTATATATATSAPSPTASVTPSPTPTLLILPPTPTATPVSAPTASSTATAVATVTPSLVGQIAFPRFSAARGTYDVYVCHVDGSGCRHVAAEASQPDFLPDGTQIVLHSWKSDDKGLILQTTSGQRIWRITDLIESARPSVDFDGKLYVFHSREEADRQSRLYRTYGSEVRPIQRDAITVRGIAPSWLPDGRILYSGCLQDTCGIIVMNADGTFPRQIAAGSTETNPEASPDGSQVTFMSQRDGNWEIYVVNLDGSRLSRLTHNPANDGLPAWSPDGKHIAFVSDRDGSWAIWAMRPDGSDKRRLFALGGSPDGRVQTAAPHETHGWVEERISWGPLP